ncbi:MAG: glycerate kinase, partial [Bacteroidetes bacterium]|nr:glycerate kinase [Bacteroidota bacterium]
VIKGITSEAGIRSIPTYALCGSLEADPELIEELGLVYAASVINRPMSLEEALASGYEAVKFHAFQLGRLLKEN